MASFFDVLTFIKQSRYLAPYNAFLVMQQRPGATLVLSEKYWEDKYKRKLREGAHPIVIMKIFGPVEFVYDIKDIDGINDDPISGYAPNLPTEEVCRRLYPVEGNITTVEHLYKEMVKSCGHQGLIFMSQPLDIALAGQVKLKSPNLRIPKKEQKSAGRLSNYIMSLNQNHPLEIRFASLVHELAHIFCGHLNECDDPCYKAKEIHEEEFEAEAVAYLFCYRHGFHPKSEQYLAGYFQKGINPSLKSFDLILSALKKIEDLVKVTPLVGMPEVLEISIGGYLGPSYNLLWDGGRLLYEECDIEYGKSHKTEVTPTTNSWARFWLACNKSKVWDWEESYSNPNILDGTRWFVRLKILDLEIKSTGSNAYPGGQNQPDDGNYPQPFRIFLRAVKKLIGGLPFE